jgi:two-component system CheB/CheR fusion protein
LASKPGGDPVRVWVPGASTGEEVYSITICLKQALDGRSISPLLQIFGTDLAGEALQRARAGIYPESALLHVSQDRLHRYFTKEGEKYRITPPFEVRVSLPATT